MKREGKEELICTYCNVLGEEILEVIPTLEELRGGLFQEYDPGGWLYPVIQLGGEITPEEYAKASNIALGEIFNGLQKLEEKYANHK